MSQRNDDAFAAFAIKLAERIMQRADGNNEVRENFSSVRNNLWQSKQGWFSSNGVSIVAPPVIVNSSNMPNVWGYDPATELGIKPIVASAEIDVIRAYFAGEDVIATILAQER